MKRIIIDADKCAGCKNCLVTCMQAHRSSEGTVYDLDLTDLRNESRNTILTDSNGNYKPLFCRHCTKPGCAAACMSGAMVKDPDTGHVHHDPERCAQCFMCVMSCPFGVLKPDTTHSFVVKCDFCYGHGGKPNCVTMCPTKAIYVKDV